MSLRGLASRLAKLASTIKPPVQAPNVVVNYVEAAALDGSHPRRVAGRYFLRTGVNERVVEYAPDRCTPARWARSAAVADALQVSSPSKKEGKDAELRCHSQGQAVREWA